MTNSITFPINSYVEKIYEMPDNGKLSYREYRLIPYCAEPIDPDYQSMDIYVPWAFNGKELDIKDAPILISNTIQAYTSWNLRTKTPGMPSPNIPVHPMGGPGHMGPPPGDGAERRSVFPRGYSDFYAMSRGIVVIKPGARGRDLRFGKAPAAPVDLKAIVRYIRHNRDIFPGNAEKIFSKGASAGGAISAILGASGNSALYDPYLKKIGAADERDDILGAICLCPITDIEHADMAYEWEFGDLLLRGAPVDRDKSNYLKNSYAEYLKTLSLEGRNGFGPLNAENLGTYITEEFLQSSASKYLAEIDEENRAAYLKDRPWLIWDGRTARFTFDDYRRYAGRSKKLGFFDSKGEISLFGNENIDGRYCTEFGLKEAGIDGKVEDEVKHLVNLMNPFYFIRNGNPGCSGHWFLQAGSKDTHTAVSVACTLETLLENKGYDASMRYLWDFGHGCDDDPAEMTDWILRISNSKK